MKSSSTFKRISSPNRDIEKRVASRLESSICRQGFQISLQDQVSRPGCCQSSHTYPCKTLFPTIRLTLLGSDFP
ncbi:hypothetical protein AVEN_37803-1, partial [Araneus ventricosus]